MHFYQLDWHELRSDRAQTVHIVRSLEALARLFPEWRVDLRCMALPEPIPRLFERFGLECPSNLRVGLIYPPACTETSRARLHEMLSGGRTPRSLSLRRDVLEYWRSETAGKLACFYTQNPLVLDLLSEIGRPDIPLLLELHQLKYHKQVRGSGARRRLSGWKEAVLAAREWEFGVIRKATAVAAISPPLVRQVQAQRGGAAPILLSCSAPAGRAAAGGGERDLDLVYVGQLYHWKGVATVIEALRFLPERVTLTVVGGNDHRDLYMLRKVAENYGVPERVTWVGQVDPPEVERYLSRAKIGVVPLPAGYRISRLYTSPMKIFEMIALGVPMLVSDVPALRDMLMPGRDAAFARPGDPVDWARQAARLLDDGAERRRLADSAARLLSSCTYEARARQVARMVADAWERLSSAEEAAEDRIIFSTPAELPGN